jgi:hypothetical protein
MSRLQVGVIRYASLVEAITRELGFAAAPDCRIGHGRIYLTFRNLGASRWRVEQQADHALRVAAVTRNVLAADHRGAARRLVRHAIVVVYEDVSLVRGCEATARWECVVPAGATD